MAITLKINENFLVQRNIKWDLAMLKLKLESISVDTGGVTLYFHPDNIKLSSAPWHVFTEEDRQQTIEQLKELFPGEFIERVQMRITLGTFIDMLNRIS